MSDKDSITKEYINQPDRFADLVNGFCFGGEERIHPDELVEMDTAGVVLPYGSDGVPYPAQKARDVLKLSVKTDDKAAYCILGVENQTAIHTAMPVRNMLYDAMTLSSQVQKVARAHRKEKSHGADNAEFLSGFHRNDKVLPVITIVVHWGADSWDAPVDLREMYPENVDNRILKYASVYHVNLISPADMTDEQLNVFKSDIKAVLKFIKHSKNKHELQELINDDVAYRSLDRLTAQTISVCSSVDFNIPVGEERVDMCKAIEDMKADARNEGRDAERNAGMVKLVSTLKNVRVEKDVAVQQLSEAYSLTEADATAFVNSNW